MLPDGRVEITAEIVDRDKNFLLARSANSYMLKAPLRITVAPGHPGDRSSNEVTPDPRDISRFRRRSMGTITQVNPGVDFPAVVKMSLYLNMHTPIGLLHNEEGIVLESTIDGIPPIKVESTREGMNEWQSANMPIAFVDEAGKVRAWMTTRAHTACLVHPDRISQHNITADVRVTAGGKSETIPVTGMGEVHQYQGSSRRPNLPNSTCPARVGYSAAT